jgi:hypothetical protein
MADDAPGTGGWLPPVAPGGNPPPRFDASQWAAPRPAAPGAAPAAPDRPLPPEFSAPRPAANPTAVWALVLGIGGLVLLLLSLGTLFFVTIPLSFAAFSMGNRARAAIAAGGGGGGGQAAAALWLGRIGLIAGVAAAVVLIVLIASGADLEELRRDLERELERRRQEDDGGRGGGEGIRSAVDGLRAVLRV